jgi:prepilin-type N-terminal cleavage/methylation domain-containing protein
MTHARRRTSPASARTRRPQLGTAPGYRRRRAAAGFSLIELVIVVTIIAIIAAIAIRRVSRHAEQAATNGAAQDITVLQTAIERYRAEHGNYPTVAAVNEQLTKYTDAFGNTADAGTTPYIYGPYVRKVPPVPAGPTAGRTKIAAAAASDVGWIYDPDTGAISMNETP